MPGRKGKGDERDAAADFFGDDDLDWFDDDPPSQGASQPDASSDDADVAPDADEAPASEEAGQDDAAPEADAVSDEEGQAEPDPIPEPEPEPDPIPEAEAVDVTEDVAVPEAAEGADPQRPSTPAAPPVAPPPPPPYVAPGAAAAVADTGFLDSILPKTLEPPRMATAPSPVRGGPEVVEALGVEPAPSPTYALPEGVERRREAVGVLELEAGQEGTPRGSLLLQAAQARRFSLGDVGGARARLREAFEAGEQGAAWHALNTTLADGEDGEVDAWRQRAEAGDGADASDAWRRVAALADEPSIERAALEAAVSADPVDGVALERWLDVLRAYRDDGALVDALVLALDRVEPERVADLHAERAEALERLERWDDAREAWQTVRATDPGRVDATAALHRLYAASGDAAAGATFLSALAQSTGTPEAHWLAARAWRDAGQDAAALEAFAADGLARCGPARVDQEHWLVERDDLSALASAVHAAAAHRSDLARGAAWYRLALRQERAGDADGAATSARHAVDAGFDPASAVVERALETQGDLGALIALHEQRVAAWDVPRPADRARLAELLERRDGADPGALEHYAAAAAKGHLLAARGWLRCSRRAGDADAEIAALTALVELEPDPDAQAARAMELGRLRLGRGDHSPDVVTLLERAAASDASKVIALEGMAEALVQAGRAEDAAVHLEGRSAQLEGDAAAAWMLDAARIRLLHEPDAGLATLERVLARFPEHADATALMARHAGARRPELERERLVDTDLSSLAAKVCLDLLAGHDDIEVPDELDAAEPELGDLVAIARSQDAFIARLGSVAADQPMRAVALASLCIGSDPAGAGAAVERVPAESASPWTVHLAAGAGCFDVAAEMAPHAGVPDASRRRLALRSAPTDAAAIEVLSDVLDAQPPRIAELHALVRRAAAVGDDALRRRAHETIVEVSTAPAMRAAHAAWAAGLQEGPEGEATCWQSVLAIRPGSSEAFDGARTAWLRAGRSDGLTALYRDHRADDLRAIAEDLSSLGADGALDAWRRAASEGEMLSQLGLEVLLADRGEWSELYDAWSARRERTTADQELGRLEAKRRWVLAEKLAETDRAWDLYRELHDENPDDREVLENLARIAGARGESEVAIGYLTELVDSADNPRDAARVHRRIAEVHLGQDDDANARQAFLDALDAHPEDLESLRGLRDVVRRTEDWETLHDILKREAALVTEGRKVEVQRELARVAQDHLGDPDRALDAWRDVLASLPADAEALRQLVTLAEARDDLELYLEMGQSLASVLRGAERATLLRELGVRCGEAGRTDQAIQWYEQAIAGDAPDAEAAERLEAAYRQLNDLTGVVRALRAQAQIVDDPQDKVARLLVAARVELDQRHDREAAHRVYSDVLQADPDHFDALKYEAAYLFDTGHHDEALPVHERLEPRIETEEDFDDYDVQVEATAFFYRFAQMLDACGRRADARARYERALELNPTHLPTLEAVGPIYVVDEAWEQVGSVYQKLLQLTGGQGEPEQVAHTYTMLGLVDLQQGKQDKAFKRFNKALDAFPNFVPALKGLAGVYEAREDWSSLLTAYNGVIYNATVPQDVVDAYMTKGRVLDEQMGRADKAAQHYERSLSFEAAQPLAYVRLAEMAMRRAAYEEAADFASRGIPYASELPGVAADLHLALASARQELEAPDDARQALDQALQLAPELADALGDDPLADPEAVRAGIAERMRR